MRGVFLYYYSGELPEQVVVEAFMGIHGLDSEATHSTTRIGQARKISPMLLKCAVHQE